MAGPQFYFFSGKGGVGKTTLAAATAVDQARSGRRVLITSTDPAHSLSDVFDRPIGHRGIDLLPNLRALEIDSSQRWAEAMGASREALPEGKRKGRLARAVLDAMGMLGEAPGIDEYISLEVLLECMSSAAYDTVVFDTAPTGHTLRLLQLPHMLGGWIGRMMAIRGSLTRFTSTLRRLLPAGRKQPEAEISQGLTDVRERVRLAEELLKDRARTLFALVSIPEAMSVFETERTLRSLEAQGIPVGVIFVNQFQPVSTTCEHCRLRREIHEREERRLAELARGVPLLRVETAPRVIRGLEPLAELGRRIWPVVPFASE